jgi:hypothetical protein
MPPLQQRWFHLGSLALFTVGLLFSGRGLLARQAPAQQTTRPHEYRVRIEGMCHANWGEIRRATLHFPDIPLTRPVEVPATPTTRPIFETNLRSPKAPERFQITLRFQNGGETTARGRLTERGEWWVGQFEDYKVQVEAGKGLGSQAISWVKDPHWANPAAVGKKDVAGTPLHKAELLRVLPPRRVEPQPDKGHDHPRDHPAEGHHQH